MAQDWTDFKDHALKEQASKVSVSAIGTATDEVQYITIDGTEKKLAGGSGEPSAYLKSISEDSTNKKFTVTDESDNTTDITAAKLGALTSHQDISGKQDKIYTTSSTATFTAPSTVTVTSGSESKTLTAEYSGLALVDGDWTCTAYLEGDGVSEDVEFSTSDGGHTEAETSVNFGTQSFSIVIDKTEFTGSISISATRTSTTSYCGAEADKTPTEDSNKLVTSGGVYDAIDGKQDVANMEQSLSALTTKYPSSNAVKTVTDNTVKKSGETTQSVSGELIVGDLNVVGGTKFAIVSSASEATASDTLYFITGS